MSIFKPGKPIDLSEHMLSTYQTLRRVLFIIALSFPWVLWIVGYISNDRLKLQGSMSDYYHANEVSTREKANREQPGYKSIPVDSGRGVMRNWFVGVLFVVSALLVVYKGYRPAEDRALNLAGTFAALVAVVPNSWVDDLEPPVNFHQIFAVCFFLCIAYVALFAHLQLSLSLFSRNTGVKTREISETDADRMATTGELQLPAGTGPKDAIREVRVIAN